MTVTIHRDGNLWRCALIARGTAYVGRGLTPDGAASVALGMLPEIFRELVIDAVRQAVAEVLPVPPAQSSAKLPPSG